MYDIISVGTEEKEHQVSEPVPSLQERVFTALDHAIENGYDNLLWVPAADVAADLADYDADLEGESTAEMTEHVTAWRLVKGLGL
jgi:hypothetical protein